MLKLKKFLLVILLPTTPLFVISQTKIMAGGGFNYSKFESYYEDDFTNINRINPELGYKYLRANVSFSLEQYFYKYCFVSVNANYGINEIPYIGRSRNSSTNAMRFNQMSHSLLVNAQTLKSPKDANAIRNLSLGIGINIDYLNNFKIGNKDQNNFNEVNVSRKQMNQGLIYQASFSYLNFKLSFQNSLGFEKEQEEFKEIKSLNWVSFVAGYHFVL